MMFKSLIAFTVLATAASAAAIPPLLEAHKAPANCPSDKPLSKHPMKSNETDASTSFYYHPRPKMCNPMGKPGVDNGIMMPEPGVTIHVGKWWDLQFCSTAYKETKMVSYDVLLVNSTHPHLHHRKTSWDNKKQKPIKQRTWAAHYDKLVINETVYDMTTNKYTHNIISQDIKTVDDWEGPRPGHIQDPRRRGEMMTGPGDDFIGVGPVIPPWKMDEFKKNHPELTDGNSTSSAHHKHGKKGSDKEAANKKAKNGKDKTDPRNGDDDAIGVIGTTYPAPPRRSESEGGDDFGVIGTTFPAPQARDTAEGGEDFGVIGTTYPAPQARDTTEGGEDFGVIGTTYPAPPRRSESEGGEDFGVIGTTFPAPEARDAAEAEDDGEDFGVIGTTYPAPQA